MGFPPLRCCGPMGHTVETTGGRPRRGVSHLGKNPAPGTRKPAQRSFPPVARAVAAAGVLAASVYAVNLSAGPAGPVQWTGSVAGTGTEGAAVPGGTSGGNSIEEAQREPGPPASDQVGAGALPPAILSSPMVTLAFPHTAIGSTGADAPAALTVGPAGTGRPGAGFLMAPLQLLEPSSPFGFRVSPISGTAGDFHLGQDYAAACGMPVHAADAGVVRAAGWHPWGGGNRVEIDHGDGLITTYNHLESIGVHTGDTVQAGQVIARVGTTGWSTGCHLHFEAILNGRYTNPLRWSFLQLRTLNWALPADMVSYAPGQGLSAGRISWTIPIRVDPGGEIPAAGLQVSPFPPLLPLAPAPAPSEATGVVLAPPDAQLTTTAPPPAEPSGSAASPSPTDPVPGPSPSPTDPATPTASPSPSDPATPTASPSDPTASPSPTPSPTDPATSTSTPTASPSPTPSPSPTDPGPTPTPTEPSPTAPAAATPTPAQTTLEPTPTPSPTPTPTLAPPPAEPEPTATTSSTMTPSATATTPPA